MNRKIMCVLKKLDPKLSDIVHTLRDNGFEAYFVGGAVRDLLQGKTPADYDVVTNARPDRIAAIFHGRKVEQVGKSYRICLVEGTEIATYRTFRPCGRFSDTRTIEFADTIHEDLKHRDFTINSMALCPLSGHIIDDFGGIGDLRDKVIRFTDSANDRIAEDPGRIIRACRFLAKLEGIFERQTSEALCRYGPWLTSRVAPGVAPERIRLEILKSMQLPMPSLFFRALHDIGVLKAIFPSLARCIDLEGGPHHDETVFEHSLLVGDALTSRKPLLRLAGYLHDVGKAEVVEYKKGSPVFIGHEKAIDHLLAEMRHLKFGNDEIDAVRSYIEIHMHRLDAATSPRAVRRLLAALATIGIDYHDFLRLRIADRKGNRAKPDFSISEIKGKIGKFRSELAAPQGGVFSPRHLAVSGHDVMRIMKMRSGPEVGNILYELFERVLDDPSLNTCEVLTDMLKQWHRQDRVTG